MKKRHDPTSAAPAHGSAHADPTPGKATLTADPRLHRDDGPPPEGYALRECKASMGGSPKDAGEGKSWTIMASQYRVGPKGTKGTITYGKHTIHFTVTEPNTFYDGCDRFSHIIIDHPAADPMDPKSWHNQGIEMVVPQYAPPEAEAAAMTPKGKERNPFEVPQEELEAAEARIRAKYPDGPPDPYAEQPRER